MIELTIPIFPTEDEAEVTSAVLNIFPDAQLKRSGDIFKGSAENLDLFVELLAKQRTRDSARDHILHLRVENTSVFLLNKQTATRGKITFSEPGESSLGDIEVKLTLDDWEPLIERLSPPNLFASERK